MEIDSVISHFAMLSRTEDGRYVAEFFAYGVRVTEIIAGSPQMAKMSLKKAGVERRVKFEYPPAGSPERWPVAIPRPQKWFWEQFLRTN